MQVRNASDRENSFDFNGFLSAVDSYRVKSNKSWRQVSKETGVSASSLTRMAQGKRLEIEGYMALSSWADLDLESYNRRPKIGEPRVNTADKVAALLRGDPKLTEEDAAHLESLIRASYEYLAQKRTNEQDDE